MAQTKTLDEAERIMTICNACRYCEGFCAVYPAMERRLTFVDQDLLYLANLCHNCRGCYYACQYRPPHEFDVNVPKTLQQLRFEAYQDYAWPGFLAGVFRRNGLAVGLVTAFFEVLVLILVLARGPETVFAVHTGEGAFYRVIPHSAIVISAVTISTFAMLALAIGLARFWRSAGGELRELFDLRAHLQAIWDALILRYLNGGGHGCNYPDEQFSHGRKWFHQMVFFGFLLSFASTTVAAFYDRILHWKAPYPLLSWPVVLGTLGGIGLVVGAVGLLWLKGRSDMVPAAPSMRELDVSFTWLLLLTGFTGLLVLIFRETRAMGVLFAAHYGIVLALLLLLPYSKFVHAVYHYMALVRYAREGLLEKELLFPIS